jgi:hypothetical protein
LGQLENLLKERERDIVFQVGQFFMMGWPAVGLSNRQIVEKDTLKAMAFLAMTHHRLGHRDRARAALDELRRLGEVKWIVGGPVGTFTWNTIDDYQSLLREAETLIEGKQ